MMEDKHRRENKGLYSKADSLVEEQCIQNWELGETLSKTKAKRRLKILKESKQLNHEENNSEGK